MSPSSGEALPGGARAQAEALLGRPILAADRVTGGANSRVYRISDGGTRYALKLYPSAAVDRRDRLGAEVTALRFLRRHGVGDVPGVVAADREHRIGLFEWVDGEPVGSPSDTDIDAAQQLLATLQRLRSAEPPATFPPAAEACLSAGELIAQVRRRYAGLERAAADHPALATFLADGVAPLFAEAQKRAEDQLAASGLAVAADLPAEHRSLSPSDFGFHNAIRRPDGGLTFCDFEYFGWDDPVKPVADFLLHPGMTMSDRQRRAFAAAAQSTYGADGAYVIRLNALFPLYGLRWCLILLNEFLPERWMRRVEAGAAFDRNATLAGQLVKATAMLDIASASIGSFPYRE